MRSETINLETRIKTLNTVPMEKQDRQTVDEELRAAKGDFTVALVKLKTKLPDAVLQKVILAHSLAVWSGDNTAVVKALSAQAGVASLRDVALRFNLEKLTTLVDAKALPDDISGTTADEKKKSFALTLQNRLFTAEPTAVLQRMVMDSELPMADKDQRAGVVAFLTNQPDFNIRTTSIYTALKHGDAFKGIADEHRGGVVEQLKTLQRVQAISHIPAAVPVLMKANLTSAFRIAEVPEATFLKAYGPALGEGAARQVYTASINVHIRNEHALATIRDLTRPQMAIMGGKPDLAALQDVADENGIPLNLETLFGSIDYCECDDCLSVYSPAAYFVDILQYLRNNDLDPKQTNADPKSIAGTPLEKLFSRRPDLKCLELTCENTFTVLPYIDLANEVMESFTVHLDTYPKQTLLEVFNVMGETTGELLAQPQHVNYQAYCILKSAVYPFSLPYHQAIDVIRIWLKYFGTSRWELLDIFRTPTEACNAVVLTPAQLADLKRLHGTVFDRAVDAEFLGITQEEYIILTREAFWPKEYFDLTLQVAHTAEEYRIKIGVQPVPEYYGYTGDTAERDMLDRDEIAQAGLTFVKKQFLPRTGIQYTDLVDLLKTRFINPAYPQGEALAVLDSIRFSYQFLMGLLVQSTDPKVRFAKLIAFLEADQSLVPGVGAWLNPDPCAYHTTDRCIARDFTNWVYCYFERIGSLIVLESGDGPQLRIEGPLFDLDKVVGVLHRDGTIVDPDVGANLIGKVTMTQGTDSNGQPATLAGPVAWTNGKSFAQQGFKDTLKILGIGAPVNPVAGNFVGAIIEDGLTDVTLEGPVEWYPASDTCDLDKVRLTHLDGSAVTPEEYDRIQRLIRLWHKTGWTIDETDQALLGLSGGPGVGPASGGTITNNCNFIGFDSFQDNCAATTANQAEDGCCSDGVGDGTCPDIPPALDDISTGFIHQLVSVKKLLDLTGLPLDKLLAFWADISVAGEDSLYSRLFLTHNLLGIDKVFQSDKNGNFLTAGAKMSDHIPVLMAALKMKAGDIAAVIAFRSLPDELTLKNVTALYRHSLLATLLHVPVSSLAAVLALFCDPFVSATNTLSLLADWRNTDDAGFSFPQLDYIVRDHDDPNRPIAPAQRTLLLVAKTLYDGLTGIDLEHEDIPANNQDDVTDDLVRTNAGLIYEASVVEQIIGLLDGTAVYTTNAPANLAITIPAALTGKLAYSNQKDSAPPSAAIQVTGILTDPEFALAKTLSTLPKWPEALVRVGKQARHFFTDVLFGIFPDPQDAVKNLLAGDVNLPSDPNNPSTTDDNTAPKKRLYFLQGFLPFLRRRLAHKFVVDTLSGTVGLANDVTDVLLSEILVAGPSKSSAIDVLEKIQQQPAAVSPGGWKGNLIPPTADSYTFVAVSDTQPAPLILNGAPIPFLYQQDDPNNVWWTDPVKLKAATLYSLETSVAPLQWKTAISPRAAIPQSALLPDYVTQGATEAFVKLFKATQIANGFSLSADEVQYLQAHNSDFDQVDFNAVTMQAWRRLQAYTALRDSLPKAGKTLLDFFRWVNNPGDAATLSARMAEVTGWNQNDIDRLIAPEHFNWGRPDFFRNEINLVKLQKALKVSGNITVGIDRLFAWANPASKFSVCHEIAQQVQAALRARYDQDDWEQVVKPLYDHLRQDQQQALVAFLLVQPEVRKWGVKDADGLFEFFLIDVQMCACLETSRIKQAISSVQLFVQRCLLGLEAKYGVESADLDRDRWEWMQKYRVWEANRKVFLYPENWIQSELRDDKTSFFEELEAELLQKDINSQTVEDALKNYLFKVDEVANLRMVGLFQEQEKDQAGKQTPSKLHIFGRSRGDPPVFYYRYFDALERNWYPWERVQVDIPVLDNQNSAGQIVSRGTYLIPVVWDKRMLIFFPQIVQKSKPVDPSPTPPVLYWEIKMGWSERRNGKWMSKQITAEALYIGEEVKAAIEDFRFVPREFLDGDPLGVISVYVQTTLIPGGFWFSGSQLIKNGEIRGGNLKTTDKTQFQYQDGQTVLRSWQAVEIDEPSISGFDDKPFLEDETTVVALADQDSTRLLSHPFVHQVVRTLTTDGLDAFFAFYLNGIPVDHFNGSLPEALADAYGAKGKGEIGGPDQLVLYHEMKRAYSIYNWEAAFHAPMLLVDRLLATQQFDQALQMCHYVLNPYAAGTDDKRFWQFFPFREIDATDALERVFLELEPNVPDAPGGQINEWRNNPFEPHVLARSRPSAYMKWVAVKYIEILIAYGDFYFRQNTLETIPLALQCYVLASHVYGPPGQQIPKRGRVLPQTYNSLLDKWDAFSNAMVELELVFPFSNQTPLPADVGSGGVGLANVFGFASTLYFCIPDNPDLRALRDTIDDRLFKIRHCEDIDGVVRDLPLFEPPLDPALLVQAAAQGLSLSSVLNDLNGPMPNYRFYFLLQKALELCAEVKALGNAFLTAKEKGDAEALAQLRARHESSVQTLVMEVRKHQLEEANSAREALLLSRKGPESRLKNGLAAIGDPTEVPAAGGEWSDLKFPIESVDTGGLRLTQYETEEMDKAAQANDKQEDIGRVETLANINHAVPNFNVPFLKPIFVFGGSNIGSATQAFARALQVVAANRSFSSGNAGRKATFSRQLQDRVQAANQAGYEIKNIDKQILTQGFRINSAEQEMINQQNQIDNSQQVEEFLRNKYTNQDLYAWMDNQTRTLYRQAYNLAYDLAKRAENTFRFERGLTTSNFIQYGYWDAAYDGLFSGERLYAGLKQLEAAYQEKRGHDFEISKSISLRQINPWALLQLRETGACEFALPEVLFDMDYAGHYLRRIKSVSLRIPCVLGAYTSLNCTLRLLEHKFRTSAIATSKGDYLEQTDQTDGRFSTVNVPISSIAVSSLEDESGVFELNFHDERYLPFEGSGVISKWRIQLPDKFRQFDYDTMTDVIIRLRYTSVDGGDKLRQPASDSVIEYISSVEDLSRDEGLFAAFDLKNDFSDAWYTANHPPVGATERVFTIEKLNEKLPVFTKGRPASKIQATDIYLFVSGSLSAASFTAMQGGNDITFTDGPTAGTLKSFVANDVRSAMDNLQIKIGDTKTAIDKMWLLERYTLA